MRRPPRTPLRLFHGLALVAGIAACDGSSQTDAGASVVDVGVRVDTGLPPTVTVISGVYTINDAAAANATVTVVDGASAAVTTGADGRFSFALESGSTQTVRATHAGSTTIQTTLLVPVSPPTDLTLDGLMTTDLSMAYTALGLTEDASKGILLIHFHDASGQPAGFGATLSVNGGTRFIVNDSGPVRQDTTSSHDGTLAVANVPTGAVTLTLITPAGHTCTALYGTLSVRVDAQTVTDVVINCL